MIFNRHHLYEGLKVEYLIIKYSFVLWRNLKERYDFQKFTILPQARYDWLHLSLQDFKLVNYYNYAFKKIISQQKLCGDNITKDQMLEKVFSTFHALNIVM